MQKRGKHAYVPKDVLRVAGACVVTLRCRLLRNAMYRKNWQVKAK